MIAQAGEGVPGFSGRDLPLAAGSVAAVRLWHVDMTSAEALVNGTAVPVPGLLTGVFGGVWQPGENVAASRRRPRDPAVRERPGARARMRVRILGVLGAAVRLAL